MTKKKSRTKNTFLFFCGILALVFLSGCITYDSHQLESLICTHPAGLGGSDDQGGIREQFESDSVLFCRAELATWKQKIDAYCATHQNFPDKQNCDSMQTVFSETGWNDGVQPPSERTIQYQCKWVGGWFGYFQVRFSAAQTCADNYTCEPSNADTDADAYCRQLNCNTDKDKLVCSDGTPVCDQQTGLCRACQPSDCTNGQVCNQQTGQCENPNGPNCTQGNSTVLNPAQDRDLVHGTTVPIMIGVDPNSCSNATVSIRMGGNYGGNTALPHCQNLGSGGNQNGLNTYSCTFDSTLFSNHNQSNDYTLRATVSNSGHSFELTRDIEICNDNDSVPFNCVDDPPACPIECQQDNTNGACGSYPPGCPNPPPGSCTNVSRGTHCGSGSCNQNTWTCECPAECTIDPKGYACGTDLPFGQNCAGLNCLPSDPNQRIGWKCDSTDTERTCANFNNQPACVATDIYQNDQFPAVNCGSTLTAYDQSTITGLYCDNSQNADHRLCDRMRNPAECIPTTPATWSDTPQFSFNLATDPAYALWYNLWFRFRSNSQNDSYPLIDPANWKVFCLNCNTQPDPATAFFAYYNKNNSKEGLVHIALENSQLVGPHSYALITVQDTLNARKSNGHASGSQTSERFILKIDAGYSGTCVPEDRTFVGETGATAKPRIKLDWGWGTHGNTLHQCDSNNSNGFYCDATQFSIAILDRLYAMQQLADDGNIEQAKALLAFDANLMKDGFSDDFLADFNFFAMRTDFAHTPSWFLQEWNQYFGDSARILFENNASDANMNDQSQLQSPGQYHVRIVPNWESNPWQFFDGNKPTATIRVQFSGKIADATPAHLLYRFPFDSKIGETRRPGENQPNRKGYGVSLAGTSIPLSTDNASVVLPQANLTVKQLSEFLETNETTQRGKLLSIDLTTNTLRFAPVTATPIAMKIEGAHNAAQAFFVVSNNANNSPYALSSATAIGSWRAIGSHNLGNACTGFFNQPLFFRRSDTQPSATGACTSETNSRGFWWSGIADQQAVFLQSVLYAPRNQHFSLVNYCDNTTAAWVSPTELAANGNYGTALDLSFTQNTSHDITNIQDILDQLENGWVCQHQTPDGQRIDFYWDKNQLEKQLEPASGNPHNKTDIMQASDECQQ